ncbi:MAG: hypothetical protein ABUL60_10805 [Myxococcales bacterium]
MASRCLAGVLAVLVTGLVSCGDQREPASASGGAAVGGSAGVGGSFEPVLNAAGQYGENPSSPECEPNKVLRRGEDYRSCEWISSCADVSCAYGGSELPVDDAQPPTLTCAQGYDVGLPAGACCYDCVRNEEPLEPITCEACPDTPPSCANGYRAVTRPGACCPECVADPDYCNADADCVLAKRPANCCACVVAVSTRRLDADDCYTGVSDARATPDGCQPDFVCAVVDCACPAEIPGTAVCFEHHCSAG